MNTLQDLSFNDLYDDMDFMAYFCDASKKASIYTMGMLGGCIFTIGDIDAMSFPAIINKARTLDLDRELNPSKIPMLCKGLKGYHEMFVQKSRDQVRTKVDELLDMVENMPKSGLMKEAMENWVNVPTKEVYKMWDMEMKKRKIQ